MDIDFSENYSKVLGQLLVQEINIFQECKVCTSSVFKLICFDYPHVYSEPKCFTHFLAVPHDAGDIVCGLLLSDAMVSPWSLAFWRNISSPSSGSKITSD